MHAEETCMVKYLHTHWLGWSSVGFRRQDLGRSIQETVVYKYILLGILMRKLKVWGFQINGKYFFHGCFLFPSEASAWHRRHPRKHLKVGKKETIVWHSEELGLRGWLSNWGSYERHWMSTFFWWQPQQSGGLQGEKNQGSRFQDLLRVTMDGWAGGWEQMIRKRHRDHRGRSPLNSKLPSMGGEPGTLRVLLCIFPPLPEGVLLLAVLNRRPGWVQTLQSLAQVAGIEQLGGEVHPGRVSLRCDTSPGLPAPLVSPGQQDTDWRGPCGERSGSLFPRLDAF